MSKEEMKLLVEMNNMLKAKLEQQTKVYQQSLQEMQREINDLQRNCNVFNEQMNNAVERAMELQTENTKLKQDKQELIEWAKEQIDIRDNSKYMTPLNCFKQSPAFECERKVFYQVLEKLGE